jgi:SAM-dependent methyltransferase
MAIVNEQVSAPDGLVDVEVLETRIKEMYSDVADHPDGDFHFETGYRLAERLGYPSPMLDAIPPEAVESFAGVGYFFDLARLGPGEHVVDLGSGSGTDAFFAAIRVGSQGSVTGIDMTPEQLAKAERLRARDGLQNTYFIEGHIDDVPVGDESVDVVISNGVVNLSPDKAGVFREAARMLRPGGRLALADIVSGKPLAERTRAKADLWAACIAGAIPEQDYLGAIEAAGFAVAEVRENEGYRFISERAIGACTKYEVKSVSLLAIKQ